jgi:hypothetical protein
MSHNWLTVAIGTDGKRSRCPRCGTVKMLYNVKDSFPSPKYTLKDGTVLFGKAPECFEMQNEVAK